MGLEVKWTPSANKNLNSIKEYLSTEWSESVSRSFETRIKDFTEVIKEFPHLGKIEVEAKGIRGFRITKQIRIFYRVKPNRIIILSLFDTRQNPNKKFW